MASLFVVVTFLSFFRWFSPFDLNDCVAFPFGGLVARTGRTGGEFVCLWSLLFSYFSGGGMNGITFEAHNLFLAMT